MENPLKKFNFLCSLLLISVTYCASCSVSLADNQNALNSNYVKNYLQWQIMEPFLMKWLAAKNGKGSVIQSLVYSHSQLSKKDIVSSLNTITVKTTIAKTLLISAEAISNKNYQFAKDILSNIEDGSSPLQQDIIFIMNAELACNQNKCDLAETILEKIKPSSAVYLLSQLNIALFNIKKSNYKKSTEIIERLNDRDFTKKINKQAKDYLKLVQAFNLGMTGELQAANELLDTFRSDSILYQQSLVVKSEVMLKNNKPESALLALLTLRQYQTKSNNLSYSKIKILTILATLNEQWQEITLREQFIADLLNLVDSNKRIAKKITSTAYYKRLIRRTKRNEKITLTKNLSWNSSQLITEIQRNNHLRKMLLQSQNNINEYNVILKKGRKFWLKKLGKFVKNRKQRKLKIKAKVTIAYLESLLTKLVGVPTSNAMRYKLLDGLSIWVNNKGFEQRWWIKPKISSDSKTKKYLMKKYKKTNIVKAQIMLVKLLNIPKKQRQILLKSHIKLLSAQMRKIPRKLKTVVRNLKKQKLKLKEKLKISLLEDANNLIKKPEIQLLWLIKQNVSIDNALNKNQHRYFLKNKKTVVLLEKAIENKPILLKHTLKALKFLSGNARSVLVKSKAMFILADIHVKNVQRVKFDGSKSQYPIKGDLSKAISLYLNLLRDRKNKLNRDELTYQLARTYDLVGDLNQSLTYLNQLSKKYPLYTLDGEISFRRAELNFSLGNYKTASEIYLSLQNKPSSKFLFKAKYKLAWSYYKLAQYEKSIDSFFELITKKKQDKQKFQNGFLNDIVRISAIAFSNINGIDSVKSFFSNGRDVTHRKQVLLELVKYYRMKHRYNDTAKALSEIILLYPKNKQAFEYQSQIVEAYVSAGFNKKIWQARAMYIEKFGGDSSYWARADKELKNRIRDKLKHYLMKMAQRAHSKAQSDGNKKYYHLAIKWYKHYIRDISKDDTTADMYLLLAQAYKEIEQYDAAIEIYQKVAYEFPDFDYKKRKQAAYSALLAYQSKHKKISRKLNESMIETEIKLSAGYLHHFGSDKKIETIRSKMAENYIQLNEFNKALVISKEIISDSEGENKKNTLSKKLFLINWRVIAYASFSLGNFTVAEKYYYLISKSKLKLFDKKVINKRLAESIYKQAEFLKNKGDILLAIKHYQRLASVALNSEIHIKAEFEIATLQILLKKWKDAIVTLENFKANFSKHPLQNAINEKLVLAYENNKNWKQAAYYLKLIFEREGDSLLARDALWRSANLYEKTKSHKQAYYYFKKYLKLFPAPLEKSFEARERLVNISVKTHDQKLEKYWLNDIITKYHKNESNKTERMVFLTSKSSLKLAVIHKKQLDKIAIKLPLDKSLKRKQKMMAITLKYLNATISYQIADHSTKAILLIAEIYKNLASEIANSPRPKNLSKLEMQQYEILLEDLVMPFEDKAIGFYAHNMAQIKNGIYTPWIKKSLKELQKLMPARYLKPEKIVGYYEQIQ